MIKYEFTADDLTAFNKYYYKHFAPRFTRYFFIIIIIGALIGLKDSLFSREYWQNPDMLSLVPVAFILFVFIFVFRRGGLIRRSIKRYAKNNPHLFGPMEITLTDEKIITQGTHTKTEYDYVSFAGLIETDKYYFLMRGKQSALIIPRQAVNDKRDEDIICIKIKPYVK